MEVAAGVLVVFPVPRSGLWGGRKWALVVVSAAPVLPVYSVREGGGGERQQSAVLSTEREGCLLTCRPPRTRQTKIATLQV